MTVLQVLDNGSIIPASCFDLWDEEVEEVLPRQEYFGRNKSFGLDNMVERLTLGLAKLLMNMGQNPNTFAQSIPVDYKEREWEDLKKSLETHESVKTVKSKLTKRKKVDIEKEIELNKLYMKKSKMSKSKKSKKS